MRVLGPDGAEESQVVVEVHPLAAVLCRSKGRAGSTAQAAQAVQYSVGLAVGALSPALRSATSAAQRTAHSTAQRTTAHRTSLPMAMKFRAQGSGWPIDARSDPHLLHGRAPSGQGGAGQAEAAGESRG